MSSAAIAPGLGGKYLTFFLDAEEYGLEILKVREILGLMPITRVPRTPESVRGVINLRGKVIPVIDLRVRLELDATEATGQSCIIVVQAGGVEFGVIVDRVSEVSSIEEASIEPTPTLGADARTEYLLGLAKSQDRVKLLLDIDRVLSSQEMAQLRAASESEAAYAAHPTPSE
jgi:purine-binding chemotaxis protein CheW